MNDVVMAGDTASARDAQKQVVSIGGRTVQLTNLDKVLYPDTGTTKADVLSYFADIASVMLPHCRNRAATRKRWVHGVGTADKPEAMFFQKDIGEGAPDWLELRSIQHADHVNRYPLVNDLATLTWLGQLAVLEVHVPQWQFGAGDEQLNPDRLVLDLDPGEGVGLSECAAVARMTRSILDDMGLATVPVTSGSKGIHVYAALDGRQTSDQVSMIAHELARALEADHPDLVVSSMKKAVRTGKVFIDWSQNNSSKTTIAPYSLRGRSRPMVAAPRTWAELASPHLKHLDYREVVRRVAKRGDPLAELAGDEPGSREFGGTRENMQADRDRLEIYRSKRDTAKTPEPIPEHHDPAGPGNAFVIQKHDARRLHYDLRFEHDGVLVSWALPKGVPADGVHNHLAVPTEDHPLDYQFFEGTIPRGEYGAGAVEIWDHGTYEREKWRTDEVIAVLHGRPDGGLGGQSVRVVLFRTDATSGTSGTSVTPEKPQWMIHRMDSDEARTSSHRTRPSGLFDQPGLTGNRQRYSPMLATLGSPADLDTDSDWAVEMKWDGIRAIVDIRDGELHLTTRSGQDVTATYPELQAIPDVLVADSAVLDGEIVAVDKMGRPQFHLMQRRMNLTDAREIERVRLTAPVHLILFDLLDVNDRPAISLPYADRRRLLEDAVDADDSPVLSIPLAFDGDIDVAIEASRVLGLEGVVAKRKDAAYRPGKRSSAWIKIPHESTAEVIIVGWRPSRTGSPLSMASLLLAVPGEGAALRYIGRVGTGFSESDRYGIPRELRHDPTVAERVTEVPAPDASDAHWVTPSKVGEVVYRSVTPDGRLRHAVWRGWRTDKRLEDMTSIDGRQPEDTHRQRRTTATNDNDV